MARRKKQNQNKRGLIARARATLMMKFDGGKALRNQNQKQQKGKGKKNGLSL